MGRLVQPPPPAQRRRRHPTRRTRSRPLPSTPAPPGARALKPVALRTRRGDSNGPAGSTSNNTTGSSTSAPTAAAASPAEHTSGAPPDPHHERADHVAPHHDG